MTATISESYRRLQKELHAADQSYGSASLQFASGVAALIAQAGVKEMLDYGAGKGRLGEALHQLLPKPPAIHCFDPAVPEWAVEPSPRELVACIDVLEHVEPEYLERVLDELKRLTLRFGFFTVHCMAARKTLSDGRNAHLTQQRPEWWLPRFMERFDLAQFQRFDGGFWIVVEPQGTSVQTELVNA